MFAHGRLPLKQQTTCDVATCPLDAFNLRAVDEPVSVVVDLRRFVVDDPAPPPQDFERLSQIGGGENKRTGTRFH
jgi:hypothetical protein